MAQLPSYMSKVTLFSRKFGHPSEFWSVIRAEAWLTGLAATGENRTACGSGSLATGTHVYVMLSKGSVALRDRVFGFVFVILSGVVKGFPPGGRYWGLGFRRSRGDEGVTSPRPSTRPPTRQPGQSVQHVLHQQCCSCGQPAGCLYHQQPAGRRDRRD